MATLEKRGLGVGNLKAKNLCLIGKWVWRFYMELNAMWVKVIRCMGLMESYPQSGCGRESIGSNGASIDNLSIPFSSCFTHKIGDGSICSFCNEPSLGLMVVQASGGIALSFCPGHKSELHDSGSFVFCQ